MRSLTAAVIVVIFGLQATVARPGWTNIIAPDVPGMHRQDDMLLTQEQQDHYFGDELDRTGLIETKFRWNNNTVPVSLSALSSNQSHIVWDALADMETKLCVKFTNRTTEQDYVLVTNTQPGCWSIVGKVGGVQHLNLHPDCFQRVIVQHEFIHALGFFHMQTAYDRDDYVRIMWKNIRSGMEGNFQRQSRDITSQFGVPYDYHSIMHYSGTAFSVNGEATIVPLKEGVTISYPKNITDLDIKRIKNMYCPEDDSILGE